MIHQDAAQSVAYKIALTLCVGAISFPLTNLAFPSLPAQLAMSAGVGSVILIIQFLIDFEQRLAVVERRQIESAAETRQVVEGGFAKINDATRLFGQVEAVGLRTDAVIQLVQKAAEISSDAPPLVYGFVQLEIDRVSQFLREMVNREVSYEGEDHQWLLTLTRSATSSIDATSLSTVDAGGNGFDGGFWGTELGRRYLETQREAVQRNVKIRRVFILERDELANDPELRRMCRIQANMGIDVRVLYPTAVPSTIKSYLYDFILFDNVLSYEVTTGAQFEDATKPAILHTRLVMRTSKTEERIERYRDLWISATPFT